MLPKRLSIPPVSLTQASFNQAELIALAELIDLAEQGTKLLWSLATLEGRDTLFLRYDEPLICMAKQFSKASFAGEDHGSVGQGTTAP